MSIIHDSSLIWRSQGSDIILTKYCHSLSMLKIKTTSNPLENALCFKTIQRSTKVKCFFLGRLYSIFYCLCLKTCVDKVERVK